MRAIGHRRDQGIAVGNYGFTLDDLTLKPSGFCNIGVKMESVPFPALL
jgi:hypothetical protein